MYTTPLDSFVAFMEVLLLLFIPLFLYEEGSELMKVVYDGIMCAV